MFFLASFCLQSQAYLTSPEDYMADMGFGSVALLRVDRAEERFTDKQHPWRLPVKLLAYTFVKRSTNVETCAPGGLSLTTAIPFEAYVQQQEQQKVQEEQQQQQEELQVNEQQQEQQGEEQQQEKEQGLQGRCSESSFSKSEEGLQGQSSESSRSNSEEGVQQEQGVQHEQGMLPEQEQGVQQGQGLQVEDEEEHEVQQEQEQPVQEVQQEHGVQQEQRVENEQEVQEEQMQHQVQQQQQVQRPNGQPQTRDEALNQEVNEDDNTERLKQLHEYLLDPFSPIAINDRFPSSNGSSSSGGTPAHLMGKGGRPPGKKGKKRKNWYHGHLEELCSKWRFRGFVPIFHLGKIHKR